MPGSNSSEHKEDLSVLPSDSEAANGEVTSRPPQSAGMQIEHNFVFFSNACALCLAFVAYLRESVGRAPCRRSHFGPQ